jgi:hypothetical protein
MKTHRLKRENVFVAIGSILVLGLILICCSGCDPDNDKCCSTSFDTLVVDSVHYAATNEMVPDGFDLAVTLSDWCSHDYSGKDACCAEVGDDTECQCAVYLDTLYFMVDSSLFFHDVPVKIEIPKRNALPWDTTITVNMDPTQSYLLLNKRIVEGTRLSLNLPIGFSDTTRVSASFGGLCIAVNIDGGDGDCPD